MKINSKKLIFGLLLLLIFTFVFDNLNAQVRGRVTGRVTDASSGDFLPGANVVLQGTNFGDASDRAGVFVINNVPPGTFTLVVTYMGYERFTTEVSVTGSATATQDVALSVTYVEGEEVVVEGLRQGQIKALSQQRMAANIKNVVAREQMERFPDDNVAEVVKRIPGIYVSRDQGEGRYIHIRGTEPRLSTVTVNGERLPTTRGEERFASLDIIGANQMASIEVVKALTPDMDADAIGGTVNLVTRSAFDYEGSRFRMTLGSGYGDLVGNPLYQGKMSYSTRFGTNNNIGFTLTSNFDRSDRGAENNEFDWDEAEDVNNNVIPWALDQMDLRDYYVLRERYGIGAGLEYRINENNRFFVRGMWNQFNDDEHRGRWRIRVGKGDYLNPEGTLTKKSRLVTESKDRTEENNTQQYSFGGVHQLGTLGLDYTFAYGFASELKQPQIETEWEFDEKVDLALDLSDYDNPKWDITNMETDLQYDASHYELDGFDYRSQTTENSNYIGSVNFKLPYTLSGLPSELKFGGKFRTNHKARNDNRWRYKWEGDDDVTMDQLDTKTGKTDFLDGNYRYAPIPEEDALFDFFYKNRGNNLEGELDYWDSEGQSYDAKEGIYSIYGMTTINMGKMMILGGFRNEYTALDYTGMELMFDSDGDFSSMQAVSQTEAYNNFLPMLHLRYRITPMSNARLAFTNTIARPNFWDLAPRLYINPDDEEIISGNTELNPTTAMNLDLMGEHYLQGIGIVSGGFFYKSLKDIIFIKTEDIDGGTYDGYEREMPVNGGDASLYGFEVNWNQQLTFLPGFLNGFGIYANYSHTWAEADLTGREGFLPGQSGDVINFALSYEKYGFSSRLSITYQGEYIEEVGKNEDEDEYRDDHFQIDFSASKDLWGGLQIFVEAVNLGNEPQRNYLGHTSRPIQREFYSWWMKAGLKLSM